MNIRSDSILAHLSQSQLADLYDWILASDGYASVQTRAAKPIAEGGVGLNIHITTLTRFYAAYTAWLRAQEIADGERDPDSSPDELHKSAASQLAHSINDLAHGPLKPNDLKLIAKYLQQHRDHALKTEYLKLAQHHATLASQRQQLAEDRSIHDQRKFEFCAAREVMQNFMFYKDIEDRTDIDDIDKIWAARTRCFGREAVEEIDRQHAEIKRRQAQRHTHTSAAHRNQDTIVHTGSHSQPANPPSPLTPLPSFSPVKNSAPPLSPPCPPKLYAKEGEPSTQIHAPSENPVGPPGSRPASAFSLSPQSSALSTEAQRRPQSSELSPKTNTQIHALPEPPQLRTQNSGLRTEAKRTPDTLVHTGSHYPANHPPLGSPGSTPASTYPLSPPCPPKLHAKEGEPSTQLHAAPDTPLSPQSSSLSPEASRPTRSLDPKPPAAWLAAARHPADLRRHFAAQYCGHSPLRLQEFLASTEPLPLPMKTLKSFDELP